MTPIITGPANFDVLIVDSMSKPNHKVAENITRRIKTKLPGASVNCTSSKKIQQKDENNCGPLTIFNVENLSHSSRPKITDVHIPSSTQINAIRQRWEEHPSSPMVPSIPPALLVAGSISSGGKTFTKKLC